MSRRTKAWLIIGAFAVVVFVVAYLLLGLVQGLVAVMAIAATSLAVGAGNKNAKEVDAYRKEWLTGQKKQTNPPHTADSDERNLTTKQDPNTLPPES